jgi:uncharacterized membrane protein
MAVLAYFGILVVVPLVAAWKSPFARYHANQGVLMLFVWAGWGCIHGVSMSMLRALLLPDGWRLLAIINAILTLVYAAILVLTIAGIVNAVNGKAKEVPIVGRFRLLK